MSTDPLQWAHPLVRDWFLEKLGAPTEPQKLGWASILAKKATLISAPTGSGKTLAAFLSCINRLVKNAISGKLADKTEILYISPLKALSNDIQKNLMQPISEIEILAKKRGIKMQKIEVAVRTGDTKPAERQRMLKKPPHILVTTPESLFILLTADKSRVMLANIKTVIIDEIHAMINSKRGTHLLVSLERLEAITAQKPLRIGLSATQKPIELVARYLVGSKRPLPTIINTGHKRKLELKIEVPNSELGPVASNELWDEIYDKIAELSKTNRSILVFVNTRRLSERIAHNLSERIGEDKVAAHHGSLSRKIRHEAENKLKDGELKILVATASLELGIDIGTVDLVCQIGTPRSINVALQRIGRSGHWYGAISKGIFFASTRDDLFECAALIYAIKQGELDALIIPNEPMDILAQQIIACCATNDWQEKDLFNLFKKTYVYKDLTQAQFDSIIDILSEGIAGSRGRYGAYLFHDKVNGIIKARRGARLAAITSGGAIPETGLFSVVVEPEGQMVGTLDEDFAIESSRDDIILLGTTSWRVIRIESTKARVLVENAHGLPPSVPFWRGEAPGRSNELSYYVSKLREHLHKMLVVTKPATVKLDQQPEAQETIHWLMQNCGLDTSGAEQIIEYILLGRAVLGSIPTQENIIAERFFDEAGGMQLIIHAPFGMKINKAWGLALRKRFCRSFDFELQAAATDNGLNISLAEQHSFPLEDVFKFLHPNTLKATLTQAVLQSPIFKTRWKWTATRSLALLRFRNGKKVPPHIQRILSDDLLAAIFPDSVACQDNLGGRDIELPSHPLIDETMKEALEDALDLLGLQAILQKMIDNTIQCKAVDTPVPSVFSAEILNANPYAFLDDAPLEERRARAVEMRRILPESILEDVGKLDPDAILEVQKQAWPDIRNADEFHDACQTFIAVPKHLLNGQDLFDITHWDIFIESLLNEGRIGSAILNNITVLFAAEKQHEFSIIYPEATYTKKVKKLPDTKNVSREQAIIEMIKGWMLHLGPTSAQELSELLLLQESEVLQALLNLENTGLILRGHFKFNNEPLEWCERRLLARIHRLTVGKLRREIQPVTITQFMTWLFRWQHVTPNTKLEGEHGLLEIIKQLQGFEIPANAWERDIFSKRMTDYEKWYLDQLCLTGKVGWCRFSPHSVTQISSDSKIIKKKKIVPTSVVPITFFLYEDSDWLPEHSFSTADNLSNLSLVAKNIYNFLKQKGASFFHSIERGVKHLKSEIEMGLWELVAAGAVTADSFDNLRSLIHSKRRLSSHRRMGRTAFATGRWYILENEHLVNEEITHNQKMESLARVLLKRYGIVFRDLLGREKNLPRWRELLIAFRRLEDRGEVRGGRFVDGFLGEQFAIPYAVDSLRALRNASKMDTSELKQESTIQQSITQQANTQEMSSTEKQAVNPEEIITISPTDPLNLLGVILPGARITSTSKKSIIFKNGSLLM